MSQQKFKVDGGFESLDDGEIHGTLDMSNYAVVNLGAPTTSDGAATNSWIQAEIAAHIGVYDPAPEGPKSDTFEPTSTTSRVFATGFEDNTIQNIEAPTGYTVNGNLTITEGAGALGSTKYLTGFSPTNHIVITDIIGNTGLVDGSDRTFIAWYKGTQTAATNTWSPGVPIFGDPRGSVYSGLGLNNGKIAIGYGTVTEGTTNVADDQWHCLAWVFDDATTSVKIYVDGIYEGVGPDMSAWTVYIRYDHIGWGYPYGGVVPPTALDGIQVYASALTATEIQSIANGQ